MNTSKLERLLNQFLCGEHSLNLAKEIEGEIALIFPAEHPTQQVAEMLAQYAPGGGDLLYSESEVLVPLEKLLSDLRHASNN